MSLTARTLRVAAAQTGPVAETAGGHIVEQAMGLMERAASQGVQLMTFPELFLAPFFPNRLEQQFDPYFMTRDDPVLQRLIQRARQARMALVLPYAERAPEGWFNSALIVHESGEVVGNYRKTHIPAYFPNEGPGGTGSYEKFYFGPGSHLDVFDVAGVRLGVQICNDRLYPEASRVLAVRGAELIVMPIAFSTYANPTQRASIWEVPLRARAYENGVFVLASNRVGTEGQRQHLGRSMVVDPMGMILGDAGSTDVTLLVQDIDLNEVRQARTGLAWWRDRRPDLYGPLV